MPLKLGAGDVDLLEDAVLLLKLSLLSVEADLATGRPS